MMVVRHIQYTLKSGKMDEFLRLRKEYADRFASTEGIGVSEIFMHPNNPNTVFGFVEFENERVADALQESDLMKEYGAKLVPLIDRWDLYKEYISCETKSLQPLTN
jgi:quinol monooxygenase YgiN